MAFAFATVASTVSTAEVLYNLKTVMKANGYTVLSSSDGATYNASGDAITSVAEMETPNAWFRIRQPTGGSAPHAGVREWVFQVCAAVTDIRIKYSLSAPFTGGSPGILRTPSAVGEQYVAGGGTDASPTGLNCNLGGGGSPAYVAVETASPFAWYMNHYYVASATSLLIGFDPVTHAPYDSGDLDDSDLDPYVLYAAVGEFTTLGTGIEQSFCNWYGPNEDFWGLVNCATWLGVDSTVGFPGARTVGNPYNLAVDTLPVPWAGHPPHTNFTAPASINTKVGTGLKGFSKHLKFTEIISSTIFNGDKLTLVTTRDHLMMGNAAFPWNGT